MEKSLRELLLKDLCARLPYDVCVHIRYKTGEPCYGKLTPRDIQWFIDSKIENIKPYLRPMNSMTQEEAAYDRYYTSRISDGIYSSIDEYIDWLSKKSFDFRHLIPKGLALEAPEDMYK